MNNLSKQFIDSLAQILPADEINDFIYALNTPPNTSIRVNPFKLNSRAEGEAVAWSRYGAFLAERDNFTLDPKFHAGAYYVQESSSMFLEHIFSEVYGSCNQRLTILDLCASPGGKTTLLSSIAGLESTIHANEVIRSRANTLADNVRKWGLANVVVTNNDPSHFEATKEFYDLIVVDAPCSGEGMFRKNEAARGEWSPNSVELCAARQKRIVSDIWSSLKPGGVLIYSTCTFNRKENEENIAWICEQYDCEGVDIPCKQEWGVVRSQVPNTEGDINCFRFYPHKVKGEGFFVAVLRKSPNKVRTKLSKARRTTFTELSRKANSECCEWFNNGEGMQVAQASDRLFAYYADAYPIVKQICDRYSVVYSGVEMGQMFNKKFKADHSLSLFHDLNKNKANICALSLEEAQDFLRKKDLPASLFAEGLNLVCYDNSPLGWAKRMSLRVNNMYPKELRILHL